jgi:hypothetical protein
VVKSPVSIGNETAWVPDPMDVAEKKTFVLSLPGKLMLEIRSLNLGLQRQQCLPQPSRRVSLSQGNCAVDVISS